MSATRMLFYTNKAATGWAALVRRNCAAPALPSCTSFPYCAALARRIGTAPALPSCSPFPYPYCNGTAPALPFVSPSRYCISFFIGPRHMSSNSRRALLLDRIALRLQAEGIPYTEALDKTINEFLNKNLEDVFPSFDSKGETSDSKGETSDSKEEMQKAFSKKKRKGLRSGTITKLLAKLKLQGSDYSRISGKRCQFFKAWGVNPEIEETKCRSALMKLQPKVDNDGGVIRSLWNCCLLEIVAH